MATATVGAEIMENSKAKAQADAPAVVETGMLEVSAEAMASDWGAITELEATDLLVPKVFHQQALSEFASAGKAKAGDFCDSLTGEVLAKREDKLEVIVFGTYKTVQVSKLNKANNKWEFEKTITIIPEVAREWANRPFTEEVGSDTYRNALYYNYYVLLPAKLTELPFVLSLGSTKTKAAKKLNTMLFKLSQLKRNGASVVFELKSIEEQNDQGKWWGIEVLQGRNSTAEELTRAYAWHMKSKSQKFATAEESGGAVVSGEKFEDEIPF